MKDVYKANIEPLDFFGEGDTIVRIFGLRMCKILVIRIELAGIA